MNIQEISKEAKEELKRLLEDNSNPSIRTSVMAVNLSIFQEQNQTLLETNANLQTGIIFQGGGEILPDLEKKSFQVGLPY